MKTAATHARALGFTLRKTCGGDFVAYPKGRGENAPESYFSPDLSDALATVRAMASDSATARAASAMTNRLPESFWANAANAWRPGFDIELSDYVEFFDLSDPLACNCDACGDISGDGFAPCPVCSDPTPCEPTPAVVPFKRRPSRRAAALDQFDSLGLDLCDPWANAFDSSFGFDPTSREGFAL